MIGPEVLTPIELEIVADLATGLTGKECAVKRGRSHFTVKAHRGQVYLKLGINKVALLTHWAIAHKLTPLQFKA